MFPEAEFELVKSKGGAFEISLDGKQLFSKLALERFPAYQEIPQLVG